MEKEKKVVVLVTGASGFFGGRLCRELINRGYNVRAFDLRYSDAAASSANGGKLEVVVGDVTDYDSIRRACSGCDVIIHSAAIVEAWVPDPSKLFSVNVGGLKNVVRAFKETGTVEKIVYTSSYFALGSTDGYVADETQTHSEKHFCTEYEKSKTVADKVALEAASEGVPIVLVYPGFMYGTGNITTGNIIARLIIERFNGRLPGYIGPGNDIQSFSYVDDVVDGHIAAMEKGRVGERYLLSGENASLNEIFNVAATITHTNRPSVHIPLCIVEVYGWIALFFSKITGKLPLISPPAVDALRHHWAYSCDKARMELNYRPRSLKEGLSEVLPWLKSLGLIKY